MKRLLEHLFSPDLPINLLLFNTITIGGLIGGIISVIVSFSVKLPWIQSLMAIVATGVVIFGIYLGNCTNKRKLAELLIIIVVSVVVFPVMFITGGGSKGGMPHWFVMGIVFNFLLLEGKTSWILAVIQIIISVGCFAVEIFYPEAITPLANEYSGMIDIVQCMLIAALTIGLIVRFQIKAYEQVLKRGQQINEQLEHMTEEANRANQAKSEFLSNMSHDIRTPMNVIIGMTKILKENIDDPERLNSAIEKIEMASEHMLTLINDVLDMRKVESGKMELLHESFNIIELLKEIESIVEDSIHQRNIQFESNYEKIVHKELFGSTLQIKQILMNIMSNAIKYNKEGGKLIVSCEEIATTSEEAVFRFVFQDTGIGMKKEFVQHIFEAFSQEDNGSRAHFKGTGLGMAIVKKMIDLMNGKIEVESEYNVGSKFTVELPLELNLEVKNSKEHHKVSIIDLKDTRILVAEDNELNMEITQYMLEERGVNVIPAYNGQEAVDIFSKSEENTIDLILMDIMMPIMDGIQATQTIRSLSRTDAKNVPIIAVSANAYVEDVQRVKAAGMNEHIAKPIDSNKLFSIIESYVGKVGEEHLVSISKSQVESLMDKESFLEFVEWEIKSQPEKKPVVFCINLYPKMKQAKETVEILKRKFRLSDYIAIMEDGKYLVFVQNIDNQSILIRRADAIIAEFGKHSIKACIGISWNKNKTDGEQMIQKAVEICKEAEKTDVKFGIKQII